MKEVALNIENSEFLSDELSQRSSYSAWAKAGLVFGTSVGAFTLAKTSGALSWLGGLWSQSTTSMGSAMQDGYPAGPSEIPLTALNQYLTHKDNSVTVDLMQAAGATLQGETEGVNPVVFEELALSKSLPKSSTTEFQVNTFTNGDENTPSVAALSNGGFVVTWTSSTGQDGSAAGVYGQRYNATGATVGDEFKVNTFTDNAQFASSVAALTNGGFVVTWTSSGGQDGNLSGVYGQRYDATGATVGSEFRVNTFINGDENTPSVVALSNGGFVVTWTSSGGQDGSAAGVYAQRYDATGATVGAEFRVNTFTDNAQFASSVAALANGGFVVTWESADQDGNAAGIYGQRYEATGVTAVGNEFKVNTFISGDQQSPSVAALANGGFVVTWHSDGQDGSGVGIYGQRYDAIGTAVGNEFRVNTFINSNQVAPSVAALANGGFVVTWQSNSQDGSSFGIYGQHYDAAGVTLGNEFQINTFTTFNQVNPAVAALANEGFVATWASENQDGSSFGIYARLFAPPLLTTNTLTINQGQTLVLSSSVLSATDSETASGLLSFTVSNVQNGRFAFGSSPGVAITSFTQQQLSDGEVVFIHTGGPNPPTYSVSVSDGFFDTDPVAATIQFDASPLLLNNVLAINQSQIRVLNSNSLSATDDNAASDSLAFTVSNVQNGHFEFVSSPGVAINGFTQQQLNNEQVVFAHTGGQNAPSYQVSVSDGSTSTAAATANINFNASPVLINNRLRVNQGQTLVLSSDDLSVTDDNASGSSLIFSVSNVQNGRFELGTSPGVTRTSFTETQLNNAQVIFVHTGGQNAPSYQVSVSDGTTTTSPVAASIDFNVSPILAHNILTVNQGQSLILSAGDLSATDSDNASGSLLFTVSNVQQGHFSFVSNPNLAIFSFTQQQLSNNQVRFVHTGGQNAPSYAVSVGDGATNTSPVAAIVHFNANPVLVNNILTINRGQKLILTENQLSATGGLDGDSGALVFTVSEVAYGRFERISNAGNAILSFSQAEISNRQIAFVHDGGEEAPTYKITVSNEVFTTAAIVPTVDFNLPTPTPIPTSGETPTNIALPISVSIVGAVAAGVIGMGFWRYQKYLEEQRGWGKCKNLFANEVRKALHLSLGSHEAPRGEHYLKVIDELKEALMKSDDLSLQQEILFTDITDPAIKAKRKGLIQDLKKVVQSGHPLPLSRKHYCFGLVHCGSDISEVRPYPEIIQEIVNEVIRLRQTPTVKQNIEMTDRGQNKLLRFSGEPHQKSAVPLDTNEARLDSDRVAP